MSGPDRAQKRQRLEAEVLGTPANRGMNPYGQDSPIQQPGTPSLANSQQTPASSSKAKSISTSTSHTAAEIEEQFRSFGMVVGSKTFDKYPRFKEMVTDLIKPARASAEKQKATDPGVMARQQRKFDSKVERYGNWEACFLEQIMPMVIRQHFQPSAQSERDLAAMVRAEMFEEDTWQCGEMTEWDGLGLNCGCSQRYLTKFNKNGMRLEVVRHSEKSTTWGLTIPEPDRVYLFNLRHFDHTIPQGFIFSDKIKTILNPYGVGRHPFFLEEGKSLRGDVQKMKNQALNDTAVTIENERQLFAYANREKDFRYKEANSDALISYPDYNTYIFVATISGEMFRMYVAWAEVFVDGRPNPVTRHMSLLQQTPLSSPDSRELASRWCHNVLEWGLLRRKREIEVMRYYLVKQAMIDQGLQPLTLRQANAQGHLGPGGLDGLERELEEERREMEAAGPEMVMESEAAGA